MSNGGRSISVLNVAEKPSVAKSVATILSRNQGMRIREGRSRYNKIFEFNYSIRGQPCRMLVTSVTGHVMELDFDDRYRKWHSCDPAALFEAPVRKIVPQDKLDIKRTLEEESRRCQWLVLWLDCDREGENIAFEVIDICTAVNQRLTIKRARFSALIEREIHESVQNLVEPNQWFAHAVDARQEIDLRIGASFTRFQTMLLRDAFVIDSVGDDRNLVLSYGPCQFPTLGFVVERYWEVQSHEPEEFWTINCNHRSEEGLATFNWMRGHLFDYTCAIIIYEMCIQEPSATVTKVRQQEKYKYPPHPLNTIELEKRASRYFRMSSEHTMKVAEELYQAGFISYPRTETDSFSARTNLQAIVQEQLEHPVWGSYAQQLLDPGSGLWRNPSNGGHDDKAHPPIHPTKFSPGENNWSQDHHFVPTTLTLDSGVTRPPPLLSEADLLSCMDKAGIGTDATMHDHIKKLLDRFYVTKDQNTRFSPTNLGEALVMGYDDMGYKLWKPNLRSMMEFDMKAVSEGSKSKTEVLQTCLQQMKACFIDARLNKEKLFEAMSVFFDRSNRSVREDQHGTGEVVCLCQLCNQSNMVLKQSRDGNFMVSCLGYPLCRNVVWLPGSVSEAAITSSVCNSCTPRPIHMIQFKFRRSEIPPNYNVDHLGCIGGCDDILRQLTEICGTGSRMPARGRGSTQSQSTAQTISRQQMCTNCRQTGHSLGDCPSVVSAASHSRTRRRSTHDGEASVPCSRCGASCTVRTANTANNRGRKFYSCQAQGCNFFVWADSLDSGTGGGGRRDSNGVSSRGRGRGSRGSTFVSPKIDTRTQSMNTKTRFLEEQWKIKKQFQLVLSRVFPGRTLESILGDGGRREWSSSTADKAVPSLQNRTWDDDLA
ncbi:hypothetical protein SAY87_002311 [Trapa incisa]|uniref:DNA topoisomerase n=1 Tax=Trapa incisa TaxID=236973 RepID=A0AAN7JVI3_9MYRT|nr:hypothetical protein SAY87_002311 [Trapa incisa]